MTLEKRLAPFLDAGMLDVVPSPAQIRQGELEMALYVISADATREDLYRNAPWGHPWIRQPFILSQVGPDHFQIGAGLGSSVDAICAHLHFTFHQGMPSWDLQLLQTHPGGLDRLRERVEGLLAPATPAQRRQAWLASRIVPDATAYHRQFLGERGWIARAERLDYPAADSTDLPPEFADLTAFLSYVRRFPVALSWAQWARQGPWLATRRIREGRRMGWFVPLSRQEG